MPFKKDAKFRGLKILFVLQDFAAGIRRRRLLRVVLVRCGLKRSGSITRRHNILSFTTPLEFKPQGGFLFIGFFNVMVFLECETLHSPEFYPENVAP